MKDIIMDGKNYNFVGKYSYNSVDYIVFCDEEEIYVSEYRILGEELELKKIDIKKQKEILESLGIDYGI